MTTDVALLRAGLVEDGPLARLATARALLAEARTVDEVKAIRDKAEAARVYAREARLGLEAQNFAAEVKLRAERRAGEVLADVERQRGERTDRTSAQPGPRSATTYQETLRAAEIAPTTAKRWQAVARLPEPLFEQHIAAVKDAGRELTTGDVVRLATARRTPEAPPEPGSAPTDAAPLLRYCPPDWSSARIVAAILRVHFPDARTALDLTYGLGGFWDGSAHVAVTGLDRDAARGVDGVADFRRLWQPPESYDVAIFDPPHVADAGDGSLMAERFGTEDAPGLEASVRAGCVEAWCVSRLGVIVKVTDHMHGQRYVKMSDWVRSGVGAPLYDEVHQTRTHALMDPKWGPQLSAYSNGSTYLIFRKDGPVHVRRAA